MSDDSTIVISDIKSALHAAEEEAKSKDAALLAVGGEINGSIHDLPDGEITLGRGAECTICLEYAGISRQHLKIVIKGDKAALYDLNSRNGTFLNNNKVDKPQLLKKGDMIKIGSIALKFLPKGDPERLTYDKLQLEANTDGLTQCFNKTYFNNKCELEVKKSKVTGTPLSMILLDLDHFKSLNDNYGHDAGDFVLKEMSDLVRKHVIRPTDIFARYGGEEFCIIMPQTNLKKGFEIAEKLRMTIESFKFIYDKKELPVTCSLGVADYRYGVECGKDLFKRADTAVYQAKDGGRNQVSFYRE
jgi:diguanylate cyclase (GGDEF)-like protein